MEVGALVGTVVDVVIVDGFAEVDVVATVDVGLVLVVDLAQDAKPIDVTTRQISKVQIIPLLI